MATVFVNIGSNIGNRRLNLSRAMRAVGDRFGEFEMSHVVESKSWGYESDNDFLNIGMAFSCDENPHAVLDALQQIERDLGSGPHRDKDGRYADRVVDIDIVAIDTMILDDERLRLPHPHLAERDFFLVPMEELAGMWRHPHTGLTPSEMLAALDKKKDD